MPITRKQAEKLEVPRSSQLSPYLEICCLRVSANVSYEDAQSDIEYFTGVQVSRSTQQRLVHRQNFDLPHQKNTLEELSVVRGASRASSMVETFVSALNQEKSVLGLAIKPLAYTIWEP